MYAADPDLEDRSVRRFLRRITLELLERQFALRSADIVGSGLPKRGDNNERFEARVRALVEAKPALGVRDLAIGGDDVIEILVAAGKLPRGSRGAPAVGRILTALLEIVLDSPESNTRVKLTKLAREMTDD